MEQRTEVERHIDVLDGIRAVAILFIVWFHFWEQTWLTPYVSIDNPVARYLGITEIPLHMVVRYGAVFVDLLILLSAICNFYPYARAIVLHEPWPDTRRFYLRRAIRILPSYYLCIFVMLVFALLQNTYSNTGYMVKDIATHLTFTSVLFRETYIGTALNGALWTVQVEVIYYLLIPWLARAFRRVPWMTCLGLMLCSIVSTNYIYYQKADDIRAWSNYFTNYAGFYACGMLICICYLQVRSRRAENKYTQILATLAAVGSVGGFLQLLKVSYGQEAAVLQLLNRGKLMFLYSVFVLAVMLAGKGLQRILCNRFFRFVSVISYNLYIWHQVIAMRCKEFRIPYWQGDTPPNITGDLTWQWKYQAVILVLTVVIATALTYGFELPIGKYLKKKAFLNG